MIHEQEYLELKEKVEGFDAPIFYSKTSVPREMISFLKTVRGMRYPWEWFHQNMKRTVAMYNKEYRKYFMKFSKDVHEHEELQKGYQLLEKLYQKELENDGIMEEWF